GPWPSPRSWDNAIRTLSRIDEDATDVQTAALRGLVGQSAADAFMRWRIEAADFDLRAVLDDPTVEDWSDHHPSKTLTVLGAVATSAVEQGSRDTWTAARHDVGRPGGCRDVRRGAGFEGPLAGGTGGLDPLRRGGRTQGRVPAFGAAAVVPSPQGCGHPRRCRGDVRPHAAQYRRLA